MKYTIKVGDVYLGTENGLVLAWVSNSSQAIEFSKEDMLMHISTIVDLLALDLQITISVSRNANV